MKHHLAILTAVALAATCTIQTYTLHAEDWPMYGRDSSRNAVSPEKNPPTDWQVERRSPDGKVIEPARNVKWAADIGTGTYSSFGSPVVSNGLIWTCTNNERHRDPAFIKDMGCLMCFDERTGEFRWQYLTPRDPNGWVDHNLSSVGSTPLVEGDRLWFITNRWEVVCLDIGPLLKGNGEAKELWKIDMQRDLKIVPFSKMMSPSHRCTIGASYDGKIYIITGNAGIEPGTYKSIVAAPDAPSLICVNKETGKVIWTDNSPGKEIFDGQFGSPLVAAIGGRMQVIAPQGDGWLRAFDPATGALIWKCDLNPKGSSYPKNRCPIIAAPVLYENRIYIAPGRDREFSDGGATLWCIDPTRAGDVSEELDDGPLPEQPARAPGLAGGPRKGKPNPNSGVIWKFDRIPSTDGKADDKDKMGRMTASVVAADGLVIACDQQGFIHCLDARTGQRYWVRDAEENLFCTPLVCDGKVYIAGEDRISILALAREEKLLAIRNCDWIDASPIIANGVLYVSSFGKLYAIQETPKTPVKGWPQWRGPNRTNISPDTGLLDEWAVGGPPLLWRASGLGEGVPSVAVAGGRVFTLGYRQDAEFLTSWDVPTGRKLWEAQVGPVVAEQPQMRWLSQRTPTVDEDRIYVVTARGELVCLATADGAERWRKDYPIDFDGKPGPWGYCDYPLVDGDRLICTPGGPAASMVALDKRTGAVIWKCAIPGCLRSTYSAVIGAELAGVRQYIQQFETGVASVGIDGKVLWQNDRLQDFRGNVHTAVIVDPEQVFCSCGWGRGDVLLKLEDNGQNFVVTEQYSGKGQGVFDSWAGNSSLLGRHIYTNMAACIEVQTGNIAWSGKLGSRNTMVVADGHLYYRLTDGTMVLAEANPQQYVERGRFLPPRLETKEPAWSSPVIARGLLYLRDQNDLLCYDLRKDRSQALASPVAVAAVPPNPAAPPAVKPAAKRRAFNPIFVPTPQDVVERMLELATVSEDDVVYDLGCGDGRIVVTAAQRYHCKALGFDLDPECVRLSRENVENGSVSDLVDIVEADMLTQDLSKASVVTLYIGQEMNRRLLPQLSLLKPGSRIVSHAFALEGYLPDKRVFVISSEDDAEHVIYLFTTPLKEVAK